MLTENRVHCLVETSWCSMVSQCREMMRSARDNGVLVRVAENFFRFPMDRFAQTVRDSGYLGSIGRIFSYADHTGYHNNSRWIAFAGAHPRWVQSVEHDMAVPAYYSTPERLHTDERLNARFFGFPDGFFVSDTLSGNAKGHLGRHPRPGYTEWHGERGALVFRADGPHWGEARGELRRVSDRRLAASQEARGNLYGGGVVDQIAEVAWRLDSGEWDAITAETAEGRLEYVNPHRCGVKVGVKHADTWYGSAVMDHCIDFALEVRGLRSGEFSDEDAKMSLMMEIGARESALGEGRRIPLPLEGDLEADALERERQTREFGVDPMDVEGMLAISFPKP
jgi:hypothetical protein